MGGNMKVYAYGYSKGKVLYRAENGIEFGVPVRKVFMVEIENSSEDFEEYMPQEILLVEGNKNA